MKVAFNFKGALEYRKANTVTVVFLFFNMLTVQVVLRFGKSLTLTYRVLSDLLSGMLLHKHITKTSVKTD